MVVFTSRAARRRLRINAADYDHVWDGDDHVFVEGQDITSVPNFRVWLSRHCKKRGLRHWTKLEGNILYVTVYRDEPGDLFTEEEQNQAA